MTRITRWLRLLKWLDGKPLVIEPYRLRVFERAFEADAEGRLIHSLVLCGRGKKNAKSLDLVLAGLHVLTMEDSLQGAECSLLANDEGQAGDDLDLAGKLVRANPVLDKALVLRAKMIERRDGRGFLEILPAKDVAGSHGKTRAFVGFDEIHGYRDYGLLEALAPDPTRPNVLTWIASYDSLFHTVGRPLWDLFLQGKAGSDPRMLFDWHSGLYCTCPDGCEGKTPEQRANPSMASWKNKRYLDEQRRRLPTIRFRRLHLNIGGQPEGAALSAEKIEAATIVGRGVLQPQEGVRYFAFVDMSGGSSDEAVLAIGHLSPDGKAVIDFIACQGPKPPFDPRKAVARFVTYLKPYHVTKVTGDAYAGNTFRADFEAEHIKYIVTKLSASECYEEFEAHLNSGEVELPDIPTLTEQFSGLIWRGGKIDHASGEHDDWSAAASGCALEVLEQAKRRQVVVAAPSYVSAQHPHGLVDPPAEKFSNLPEELRPVPDDELDSDHEGAVLDTGGELSERSRGRRFKSIPSGWGG